MNHKIYFVYDGFYKPFMIKIKLIENEDFNDLSIQVMKQKIISTETSGNPDFYQELISEFNNLECIFIGYDNCSPKLSLGKLYSKFH